MNENLVIYCSHCEMWFDTKNGWKANRASSGLPLCPACGAPLLQIEAEDFYKINKERNRLEEVMTWEWPNGSFWNKVIP